MELTSKQAIMISDGHFRDRIRILAQDEADSVKNEVQGANTPEVWAARKALARRFLGGKVDVRTFVLAVLGTSAAKAALNAVPDPVSVSALNAALTDTILSARIRQRWTEWATD